ncbi:MAG TPA: hypothetical protein VF179_26505 [Thermoanaerobaculia bacterium]|nr:hypothetical protein [Thermoanaerobaculia bacterium]
MLEKDMSLIDWFELIASIATAVGLFLAWWQIRESSRQAKTSFEDSLASEYRSLVQGIPIEALLGEELDEEAYQENLSELYHYIDLTNEQAFLWQRSRISQDTWENWREGIQNNMSKPAFARAWKEISERSPESFGELRRLIGSGYAMERGKR